MPATPAAPSRESFLAPIRREVASSVIGTWLFALATSVLLVLVGAGMDDLLDSGGIARGVVIGLIVTVVVRAAVAGVVPLIAFGAAGRLEAWARERVYRHLLALGAPLRSREATGRLVSAATEAVELMAVYQATFVGPIIASMTVPVLVIVVIAVAIDVWSALWLFLAIPVIPVMVRAFQSRFQAVSDQYRDTASGLSARFLDALQGLPTLVLFNRGVAHGEVIAAATERLRTAIMRLLLGNQIVLFVVDAMFSLGLITAAAALAMVRLRSGAITPGEAVALVLLGLQLIEPLDKVGQFFYVGMSGQAAAKEVRAVLDEVPTIVDPADATAPDDAEPSVVFRDVRLAYGDDPEVLRGLTFDIPAGSRVALIGPSGAGKTTVANLLQRQMAPTAGRIEIGGHDLASVPAAWARSMITVVAQTTYLFTGTLRANLQVAAPDADDATLLDALTTANLDAFVAALPDGLDTPIGERGLSVSGGEAQRIAIARAVLRDAPIVVLDEPTSNVDVESEAAILSALDRLTTGRTVLVIAHRLTTVADADQIVVLADGVVAEQGPPAELADAGGLYAAALARAAGTEVSA